MLGSDWANGARAAQVRHGIIDWLLLLLLSRTLLRTRTQHTLNDHVRLFGLPQQLLIFRTWLSPLTPLSGLFALVELLLKSCQSCKFLCTDLLFGEVLPGTFMVATVPVEL